MADEHGVAPVLIEGPVRLVRDLERPEGYPAVAELRRVLRKHRGLHVPERAPTVRIESVLSKSIDHEQSG